MRHDQVVVARIRRHQPASTSGGHRRTASCCSLPRPLSKTSRRTWPLRRRRCWSRSNVRPRARSSRPSPLPWRGATSLRGTSSLPTTGWSRPNRPTCSSGPTGPSCPGGRHAN